MRKTYFSDKFKFLKRAYAKSDEISAGIDQYLTSVFKNNDLKWLKTKLLAFSQTISVVKELSTLMMYYIEKSLIETNVFTAQKEVSVRNLAEISGHNVVRAISARGVLAVQLMPQFAAEYGQQVRVQKYAKIVANNGLQYLVNIPTDEIILDTGQSWRLPVVEGRMESQSFIANGEHLFTIHLDDINIIEHYEVKVYVNNQLWKRAAGLYDMGINEQAYITKTGYINQLDIYFGTGINGKVPAVGDSIRVEYLLTSGIGGNIGDLSEVTFTFADGVHDLSGEPIEINEFVQISKFNGFDLGNAGEDIDTTRLNVGYSSRFLVLASSENMEAYLSRLPISRVNVWSDFDNTSVKKAMILPLIKPRVRSYKDYLTLSEADFTATDKFKKSIIEMVDSSRRTYVTSELTFVDPTIRKYAMMIYIQPDQDAIDRNSVNQKVTDAVIMHFINRIFSKNYATTVSKAEMIGSIKEVMSEYLKINIVFVSEQNELARFNGFYEKATYINKDGVQRIVTDRIEVPAGVNPMLGLSEHGDITVDDRTDVPVLSKSVSILSSDGTLKQIPDPVTVFLKDDNTWKQIS